MTEVLLRATREGVRTLELNRPERRNALSKELIEALVDAFAEARDDAEVRCIVLTGSGDKAFCSGADLNPMQMSDGPLSMHESRRDFIRLVRAIRAVGKPVIARVNGHAFAGGLGLMVACDMAVAADDAHFATPEIQVGLFPMMIMALIVRNIGRKKAMELVMTGDRFSAAQAEAMGLINYAVPREQLDARTFELAQKLAAYSPAILRLGRDAFFAMEEMPLDGALEYLCGQLTLNTMAEDAAEGVSAFLMKRAPEWKGR